MAVKLLHWYAMFLLIDLVTHNLYMHVTTNVVLAIPSINEYCMNVNVDARSDELALDVAKWVS